MLTEVSADIFAVAAAGGATMAAMRLMKEKLPPVLAMGHGGLAAMALLPLIVAVAAGNAGGGLSTVAVFVFPVAMLGGLALFSFHLRGRELPLALVFIHGGVALTGYLLLLLGTVHTP